MKRWLETYWCKIGRKKELYYITIQTSFVHKMILDTLAAIRQTRFVRFKVKQQKNDTTKKNVTNLSHFYY